MAEDINEGREESLEDIKDQIGAFMYSAILDERTCSICEGLDGTYYEPNDSKLEKIKPPLHAGCRCIFVAVLKEETAGYPKILPLSRPKLSEFKVENFWKRSTLPILFTKN